MEEIPYWAVVPILLILGLCGVLLTSGTTANASQINVEYWFRELYDLLQSALHGNLGPLEAQAAAWWVWITLLGYVVVLIGIFLITYTTIRIYELRQREKEQYKPIALAPSETAENKRWLHIQSLISSANSSDWRQAIIEADIMLDDMLTRQGYKGASIGDKLQQVESSDFATLQDAWEAHKVRNQIAHEGSAFDLSQLLAQRTISRFENVFREFNAI